MRARANATESVAHRMEDLVMDCRLGRVKNKHIFLILKASLKHVSVSTVASGWSITCGFVCYLWIENIESI